MVLAQKKRAVTIKMGEKTKSGWWKSNPPVQVPRLGPNLEVKRHKWANHSVLNC